MNVSKKHEKIRSIKHNALIWGLYNIKRRNKVFLYCDMIHYATLYKVNKVWIRKEGNYYD